MVGNIICGKLLPDISPPLLNKCYTEREDKLSNTTTLCSHPSLKKIYFSHTQSEIVFCHHVGGGG